MIILQRSSMEIIHRYVSSLFHHKDAVCACGTTLMFQCSWLCPRDVKWLKRLSSVLAVRVRLLACSCRLAARMTALTRTTKRYIVCNLATVSFNLVPCWLLPDHAGQCICWFRERIHLLTTMRNRLTTATRTPPFTAINQFFLPRPKNALRRPHRITWMCMCTYSN